MRVEGYLIFACCVVRRENGLASDGNDVLGKLALLGNFSSVVAWLSVRVS